MTTSFSTFTLEALVQVISGGPGLGNNEPPIGLYRSASEIDGFLMACGIDTARSEGSRLPALRGCIHWAARQENGDELIGRAIEKVADPRNHAREPGKTQAVLDHLNLNLAADGFEVALFGGRAVLRKRGSGAAVVGAISEKTATLDFGTVSRDLDRATRNAEEDPEKIEQKYQELPSQCSSQAEVPPKQMVRPIESKPRQYAKIWEEMAYVQNTMPSSKASQISSPHSVGDWIACVLPE